MISLSMIVLLFSLNKHFDFSQIKVVISLLLQVIKSWKTKKDFILKLSMVKKCNQRYVLFKRRNVLHPN